MRALRLVIWTFIVTSVVSCARNEQKIEDEKTAAVKPTAFQGSWGLDCEVDASLMSFLPGGYIQKFYLIDGLNYIAIQRGYSAPATGEQPCAANRLAYTLQESSVFVLKKNVSGLLLSDDWENWSSGSWGTITSVGRRFTLTPNVPSTVVALNLSSVCGIKEWALGKSVGVSNKNCFGVKLFKTNSEERAIRYEKTEDGKIFMSFGVVADNTNEPTFDPAQRYTSLGTNLPFSFKNPNKNNGNLIKGKKRDE
jgi:hypothetical protein